MDTVPSCGKTTFLQYMQEADFWQHRNLPVRTVMDITYCKNLEDLADRYVRNGHPGILALDLAKGKAKNMSQATLEFLEKITDTGMTIFSDKYRGTQVTLRSHIMIFSNEPPPPQLFHKKIYHMKVLDKDQPASFTMPGQQEDGTPGTQHFQDELEQRVKNDVAFRAAMQKYIAQHTFVDQRGRVQYEPSVWLLFYLYIYPYLLKDDCP